MVGSGTGRGGGACTVVVPAHDEERLIGDTLASLTAAAAHADIGLRLIVVADSCTDDTAALAAAHGAEVVALTALSVGAARRAGFAYALGAGSAGSAPPGGRAAPDWCATTDADTVVPRDWFSRQLTHLRGGADVVSGTISLRTDDEPRSHHTAWHEGYAQRLGSTGHTHVHGANLSFTPDAYRRLDGFRPLTTGEDVDLVRRAQRVGLSVVWALDVRVQTSARLTGRAPAGVAADLRAALGVAP